MSTANLEIEIDNKLTFVAYYMKCGDIQRAANKSGLIINEAKVTKIKNGLIFYIIDGETGERKCKPEALNIFRDFGTSIYGIFEPNKMEQKEYLEAIIEKLEERVLEANASKKFLLKELNKI